MKISIKKEGNDVKMNNNEELNKRILNKFKTKIAVENFKSEEKIQKTPKLKMLKFVATFVLSIGLTVSIVYAGGVIYEKVFKEPEKIENYIKELKVTQEDLNSIITKQEAINSAKQEIKKYGIEIKDDALIKTEIQKAPNYDEITYMIETSNLKVFIDANTGNLRSFYLDDGYSLEEIEKLTSSREEIIKAGEEKLKEYGFGEEYKLSYISCNNSDDDSKAYLWYLWFSKEYDGLFNEAETINMTIIPKVNLVTALSIVNEPFENNPIEISMEEAVNIAREKDKIINTENYKEKSCTANLAIKRMNPEVYLKEKGLTNGNETTILEDGTEYSYNTYKMNGKARRVYTVKFSFENRPFNQTRTYYVDVTTGEVVGGEDIFDLNVAE